MSAPSLPDRRRPGSGSDATERRAGAPSARGEASSIVRPRRGRSRAPAIGAPRSTPTGCRPASCGRRHASGPRGHLRPGSARARVRRRERLRSRRRASRLRRQGGDQVSLRVITGDPLNGVGLGDAVAGEAAGGHAQDRACRKPRLPARARIAMHPPEGAATGTSPGRARPGRGPPRPPARPVCTRSARCWRGTAAPARAVRPARRESRRSAGWCLGAAAPA